MFAGVGPFPIVLSPKASVIYAGDINPGAVSLMRDNIILNRRKNIIPMLADALVLGKILKNHSFDRVIMNLPMTSSEFLEVAFLLCKKGGMIHYYTLQSKEGEMIPVLRKYTTGEIKEKVVRSYSPVQHHAVYDICCR
jgi:tRNA (guanine37-N1)-methyltransferase